MIILQEQSTRRELRSSEALVPGFQKSLQQRDSEVEALRAKVTTHNKKAVSQPMNIGINGLVV